MSDCVFFFQVIPIGAAVPFWEQPTRIEPSKQVVSKMGLKHTRTALSHHISTGSTLIVEPNGSYILGQSGVLLQGAIVNRTKYCE